MLELLEHTAFDVELSLALVSLVEPDVLNTDEILARWDVLLDSPLQPILLPAAPTAVVAGACWVAQTGLVDLDPVAGAIIVLDTTRSLGNVDVSWTWVLDELVVEKLEANLVTSLDVVGGGAAGLGSLVASKIVAVHELVRERGVVAVAVLASVCILSTDGSTVNDQAVKYVMRLGERRQQGGEKDGLHCKDLHRM